MELRELAEQVLFGDTLELKLTGPERITDDQPGPAVGVPEMPGRPSGLKFKPEDAAPVDFPGLHRLGRERERGLLLHFFANHELLATELMALVLLRFPKAPPAFRRGVWQTLKDEQRHTRLYLARMKACGIHFGEIPVNGYFWRTVSPMENPIDYVAGLSLTFEQANLDFCRHFARGFERAGDTVTANLLDQIYRDEIGHVAYGLKWFRRWKDPSESDWQAYCARLRFPLSPSRAKGISFNVEGRRAAGLDPSFIDELNVYSQSKGRTPAVFVFNPFPEAVISRGQRFHPVKDQSLLARDLGNLPQFLCRQDDVVLVERRPSLAFLSSIKAAGFPLPEFVALKEGRLEEQNPLRGRKIGDLRPWGWGPESEALLAPLFANVRGKRIPAEGFFNAKVAALYSKAWSAAFLRKLLDRAGNEPWLCPAREVGQVVQTPAEAWAAIDAIRRGGHHKVVVKEAYGLAGHNMIRLWEPSLLETQRRWIEKNLQQGRQLVVEPWLERTGDFSLHLEMGEGGLKLRGYTELINDPKGQFQANRAGPKFGRRLPGRFAERLREEGWEPGRLYAFYEAAFPLLENELALAGYAGPLGIDAFFYRDPDGGLRLKPVVEINPRYTMGRLTLELMSRAAPGKSGCFRLVNRSLREGEGFRSFPDYARALGERFPLEFQGSPVPKISAGALCLNDPEAAQGYLAVFQVLGA
jgi:uncharacterized ferritin-like protein (DUF455 family)